MRECKRWIRTNGVKFINGTKVVDSYQIKRILLTKSEYSVHYLRTHDIFIDYIKWLILLRIAMVLYLKRSNERTTNVWIISSGIFLVYWKNTRNTLIRGWRLIIQNVCGNGSDWSN